MLVIGFALAIISNPVVVFKLHGEINQSFPINVPHYVPHPFISAMHLVMQLMEYIIKFWRDRYVKQIN
ncbi:hypothetical protein MUK42_33727 [Musa troglodytarum]|uniref:Uncharacterized protein n=1 Tax=Musa troglodytarum TaxID=320322 RepID=A0A9E7EIH4_9LILI|nr:hypothetical protein MUK42_33727 [Musa troglodytarum]